MKQEEAEALSLKFIEFLETGTAPDGLFADDVFLDFFLPKWRLQSQTRDDAIEMRRRGHPDQGTVPKWRCDPTPSGFVLEVEERWIDAASKKFHCHELFRMDVGDEGSIKKLSVYCTGDWDEETSAKHKAMVQLIEP